MLCYAALGLQHEASSVAIAVLWLLELVQSSIDMTWRSPFQASKGGGVPFPASLTPWASSPAQPADAGSPMQISPVPTVSPFAKRGSHATGLQKVSTTSKASPMDAAPYTPLSALKAASTPARNSDRDSSFVGKLSFTPHANRPSQHGPSSIRRSPVSGPSTELVSNGNRAQPPQASMYAEATETNAAVKAPATEQRRQPTTSLFEHASGMCITSGCCRPPRMSWSAQLCSLLSSETALALLCLSSICRLVQAISKPVSCLHATPPHSTQPEVKSACSQCSTITRHVKAAYSTCTSVIKGSTNLKTERCQYACDQ